jgi:hypothetical protein
MAATRLLLNIAKIYITQMDILESIEKADCEAGVPLGMRAAFARDPWDRADGSFGLTACLEDGSLIEKVALYLIRVPTQLSFLRYRRILR